MSESKENILWRGNTDFSGYVVDFAVLDSETITSPKEIDSHVINLDGIEVSVTEFKKLFYPDGNTFQLNIAEQDNDKVKMRGRTVKSVPFKLVKAITRFYGDDLGVELNCMDPCTTTEITSQITGYRSLMDFCEVNCHLSWAQIIEALYNKFPDGEHTKLRSKTHNLRLSVRFHNANKQIKDVMVTFNYEVDFTDATNEEENEIDRVINAVSAQTAGSGSSATLEVYSEADARNVNYTNLDSNTYSTAVTIGPIGSASLFDDDLVILDSLNPVYSGSSVDVIHGTKVRVSYSSDSGFATTNYFTPHMTAWLYELDDWITDTSINIFKWDGSAHSQMTSSSAAGYYFLSTTDPDTNSRTSANAYDDFIDLATLTSSDNNGPGGSAYYRIEPLSQ